MLTMVSGKAYFLYCVYTGGGDGIPWAMAWVHLMSWPPWYLLVNCDWSRSVSPPPNHEREQTMHKTIAVVNIPRTLGTSVGFNCGSGVGRMAALDDHLQIGKGFSVGYPFRI
jgi:hypothetical protein